MKLIDNKLGLKEIEVVADCEWQDFYSFADLLMEKLQINYIKKLDDFDSCYWDFVYKNSVMTVHYHVYMGISIYPGKAKIASLDDTQRLFEIFELLNDAE